MVSVPMDSTVEAVFSVTVPPWMDSVRLVPKVLMSV